MADIPVDEILDLFRGVAESMRSAVGGTATGAGEAQSIAASLGGMMSKLKTVTGEQESAAKALTTQMKTLRTEATELQNKMTANARQMAILQAQRNATTDPSVVAQINEQMRTLSVEMDGFNQQLATIETTSQSLTDKFSDLVGNSQAANKALNDLTRRMNQSPMDTILEKMFGEERGKVVGVLLQKLFAPFQEAIKIAQEGIKRASELGVSAAEGVSTEFATRIRSFGSIIEAAFAGDMTRLVTAEQIKGATDATVQSLVGLREGTEISSGGMKKFTQDLQKGFNSEFTLTAESMRALATTGATTAAEFEEVRKATGRQSLSSSQFAQIINKNQLSVLLFGTSVLKAAADAEKLGISFASIQKGQESFVTNLEGGIDTIAQLNQLGANLDFGTLTQLAEFGSPDQIMAYVKSAVPTELLQGASGRALLGQLMPGIDAETLLKLEKPASAMDEMEAAVTKATNGTNIFEDALAVAGKTGMILTGTFVALISAVGAATVALFALARGGGISGIIKGGLGGGTTPPTPPVTPGGGAPTGGMGGFNVTSMLQGAAAILVLSAAMYVAAKAFQEFGAVGEGVIPRALKALGGLVAVMAGVGLAMMIGAPLIFTGIGALALMAGVVALLGLSLKVAGDGLTSMGVGLQSFSAGLTNLDTVKLAALVAAMPALATGGIAIAAGMAVTTMVSKLGGAIFGFKEEAGTTTTGPKVPTTMVATTSPPTETPKIPDLSNLVAKLEKLTTAIENAKTVIEFDGRRIEQPRMTLAGAYERNGRLA